MVKKTRGVTVRKIITVLVTGLLTAISAQADMKVDAVRKPVFCILPAGDIKPQGWVWKQMDEDLRNGLPGNYYKVSNMVNCEIFAKKNGTLADPYTYPGGSASRSWWVGEVEGDVLDADVRLAFLTDNAKWKETVKNKIYDIIEAQKKEPDGYIGIYVPADRFALRTEKNNNGELWAQEHVFQAMLAYYEYTKDEQVLESVKKAVDCTLAHYVGKEVFFQGSGVSHGVAFVDTLEWLYRLTDDPKYVDAVRWLYEDFSQKPGVPKATGELSYIDLANPDTLWFSHTPHILEGMHLPAIAYKMTGEEKYKLAADNVLLKFDRHDTPAGGPACDEGIDGRFGTAMLPYENCGNLGAVMAFNRIAAWTGDLEGTARAENIVLNAQQGSRFHPAAEAVRYCAHDNQKDASYLGYGARYVYSVAHCAPCCVASVGRVMPSYVEGMWFADQKNNELIANYYGPNRVDTTLAGKKVSVVEETGFPFSDKIRFVFDSDMDATLVLRKPEYCGNIKIDSKNSAEIQPHRVLLRGPWKKGDVVSVDLDFRPLRVAERNLENTWYYRWGALLFALPLGEDMQKVREIQAGDAPSGMYMWAIKPLHPEFWNYKVDPMAVFAETKLPDGNYDTPFANPPVGLQGVMMDVNGKRVSVTLTPFGSSKLRRMSFPDYSRPVTGMQNELIKHGVSNPDGTMKETGAKK